MKKISFIVMLSISITYAQISLRELNNIGNDQLDTIREEIKASQNALTTVQTVPVIDSSQVPVEIPSESRLDESYDDLFGYNYFQNEINFFDNIPTPNDFKLGPGDEIILSMWGDNNIRESLTVNKDGLIFYKNIGFINVANMNIEEAEEYLTTKLSQTYSTLLKESGTTELMLELGRIKSLNIYFSGEVFDPGIHLIHPFSDAFSALVKAGGIKKTGSLRNIEIIRNGKSIDKIDFYQFFNEGDSTFSNIKLIDGDVIHVPVIKKRISILGGVNKPKKYELLNDESLLDLIGYAGGLTANSSINISIDQTIPIDRRTSDDNALSSKNIKIKDAGLEILNNGDKVKVHTIKSVSSKVRIYGKIKSPGLYPANGNSLKDILDIAGGFDDPIFREQINVEEIIVLRRDSSQFFGKEITIPYDQADSFVLEVDDKIFVYENVNYKTSLTYRVEGEVNSPGTYSLNLGTTVEMAIEKAGGLTPLTTLRNLSLSQEYTELDVDGEETTTLIKVSNVNSDDIIDNNSVLTLLPYENVVRVEGSVYNPGLITYQNGADLPRYIELAGGYKQDSLKRKVYIKRANGNIEKTGRLTLGLGKNIYPGDTIVVPINEDPKEFDITTFIADFSTTLANIAAILLIVDNQTD